MANATPTTGSSDLPALQRARALIALLRAALRNPICAVDLDRRFAEIDQLLARCIFEAAARLAGRADLLQTHEAVIVPGGRGLRIRIRARVHALHPLHHILIHRRRARAISRYRRGLARRASFSTKISYLHFRNQRRRQAVTTRRRAARSLSPTHTPSRISAPP